MADAQSDERSLRITESGRVDVVRGRVKEQQDRGLERARKPESKREREADLSR